MTTKYYLLLLSFICIFLFGCSKEDIDEPVTDTETSIVLDKETVDIRIEENRNVLISEGNGDYNAFSVNPDIADVTVNGNNIEIQGKNIGSTSIIILDKKTQLKRLPVTVYQYDKIVLEKETVDIEFRLGNKKEIRITVLEGNGQYSAVSEDETIATVQTSENTIIITSQGKEGKTNIVVTDASKRHTVLSINTTSTLIPYDEDELSSIMERTTTPYFAFNGTNISSSSYTYLNTIEDGMNLSGYTLYNFYVLKIYYPGDKSVGEKQGCKISYQNVPYGQFSDGTLDMEYFKIIKNDGSKIWAVFSLIENDMLKYGYFIQNINP